jgi:hypothetical protein
MCRKSRGWLVRRFIGKTQRELERDYTETADSCFKSSTPDLHIPKHDTVIEIYWRRTT